jgi:hypothetical protein
MRRHENMNCGTRGTKNRSIDGDRLGKPMRSDPRLPQQAWALDGIVLLGQMLLPGQINTSIWTKKIILLAPWKLGALCGGIARTGIRMSLPPSFPLCSSLRSLPLLLLIVASHIRQSRKETREEPIFYVQKHVSRLKVQVTKLSHMFKHHQLLHKPTLVPSIR